MGSVFVRGNSRVIDYRERNACTKRELLGMRGVVNTTQHIRKKWRNNPNGRKTSSFLILPVTGQG